MNGDKKEYSKCKGKAKERAIKSYGFKALSFAFAYVYSARINPATQWAVCGEDGSCQLEHKIYFVAYNMLFL